APVVAASAVRAIDDALVRRYRNPAQASLALMCLGAPIVGGEPHAAFGSRDRIRWLAPTGVGARGPMSAGLYRPAHRLHYVPALGLEAAQRLGLGRLAEPIPLDPDQGLRPTIETVLCRGRVSLAASV